MKQKLNMRKLNLLFIMVLALIMGACESETEKELKAGLFNSEVDVTFVTSQTRAGGVVPQAFIGPGGRVGLYIKCGNELRGPLPFTLNGDMTGLVEPLPTIDINKEHTVYGYFPYDANTSKDPAKIQVSPVPSTQTQHGNDNQAALDDAFYISIPYSYYIGEKPRVEFTAAYTIFNFLVNSNISGLVVESIELKAPNKIINFTSAYMDGTRKNNEAGFGQLYNISGGKSNTVLNIDNGGLNVPNSTTDNAKASMNICPFNSKGEKMTVVVKTAAHGTYTFEIDGDDYKKGTTYEIPIRIEKKKTIKNVRVLSVCEVGCLGTKDNTKQWNCYYGAIDCHAKEIRRLLYEYFGKGKLVETGVISFDKTDIKCYLNKMTDNDLAKYDIIYLNNNSRPDANMVQKVMRWLNGSENRVLMLAYDWKDACVTPKTSDNSAICSTTTNYLFFRHAIKDVVPHWYNSGCVNYSYGNYGSLREDMLLPFELNDRTKYFWKEGPFKTNLTESSDQRYWIEDIWWGSAAVTSPTVIPLISYRDARNDCNPSRIHSKGAGDNGMVLGVDPATRIVYIGDSEIFSTQGVCNSHQKNARMAVRKDGCKPDAGLNNFSKLMGNLWAWMIDEVVQK